jgi:hypothetical protein
VSARVQVAIKSKRRGPPDQQPATQTQLSRQPPVAVYEGSGAHDGWFSQCSCATSCFRYDLCVLSAAQVSRLQMLTPWACAGLNATTLTVGGKAFTDTANFWNRLPAAAKGVVQPPSVWGLSQQSAVRLVLCASHVPVAAGCCCCCCLYLPA